ncbi:carboxylate-amine ligase [Streptomyces sp. NBC_01198]|uniref:carboxylate-amine ligase n=1 Tax=Streptomyces sp. NBC_01198 TaxID=2903769 RepID=UPI002E1256C6|nr:glutamate--cysteine ligase [Streptomyces sp. NBC_01198]
MTTGVTLGVEEEFLLLDRRTGLPVPRVRQVQEAAEHERGVRREEVDSELLQAMVEVATPVCSELDEVAAHLVRFRQAVARAAGDAHCRLASTGGAPTAGRAAVPVTGERRYQEMRVDAARLVDEQLICGMHIHVAVPDRHAGAAALGRLRPWLPVLVALGANSPFWEGRDTGFASWRTVVFGRWPVSGAPPFFSGASHYEERVAALLGTGVVADRHQLYWHARLSDDYPTLEVRAPDVQLDVGSAVTLAGIARGLVVTALREGRRGARPLDPPASVLQAAGWHAARRGLSADLVDPRTETPSPAADVVGALVERITPALKELGDVDRVTAGAQRLITEGTGAARQRAAFAAGGTKALLDLIAPEPQESRDSREQAPGVPDQRPEADREARVQ